MLYLTTRSKYDAVTPIWTLRADRAEDGGGYVPFHFPETDLTALKEKTFGQSVADVLNSFFGTSFSGWDMEFSMGRNPVKIAELGQKVLVAELWHNLEGSYSRLERVLAARITGESPREVNLTVWMKIAIRIAVLHGVFGELLRRELKQKLDVAVPAGDFTLVSALLYARGMGLPIGRIICGCQDNDPAWDLLQMGQMRTSAGAPGELERLICGIFGPDEACRFAACCEMGQVYTLLPNMTEELRRVIFAAVVSRQRAQGVIPNVYRTGSYILDPETAVGYSSLMDHRAGTGERSMALLLGDWAPSDRLGEISDAMNISQEKLKELLG